MKCSSVSYVASLTVSIGVGGNREGRLAAGAGIPRFGAGKLVMELVSPLMTGAIDTVKRGVDALGSSGGHRSWCIDGPQRKKATEMSVGCGNDDICNDSRADGAGVTQETYVWTCPGGGVRRGASAEPGPKDYVDQETRNPWGWPVEVSVSSDEQARPRHVPGQEPSKAGSNLSPPPPPPPPLC